MANPQLGEVGFEVCGVKYKWCFSVQAMCCLEDQLGRGVIDITEELQSWLPPFHQVEGKSVPKPETEADIRKRMGKVRMGLIRAMFWAGLQDRHEDVSLKTAGELMKAYGGMIPALALITRGVMLAQAENEQGASPLAETASTLQ